MSGTHSNILMNGVRDSVGMSTGMGGIKGIHSGNSPGETGYNDIDGAGVTIPRRKWKDNPMIPKREEGHRPNMSVDWLLEKRARRQEDESSGIKRKIFDFEKNPPSTKDGNWMESIKI